MMNNRFRLYEGHQYQCDHCDKMAIWAYCGDNEDLAGMILCVRCREKFEIEAGLMEDNSTSGRGRR
jgi:hypothetical protein